MSAVHIIERIEQFDDIYKQLEITAGEEDLLDRESYKKFKDSLLSILEIRKEVLYERSKILSNHMTVGQPNFKIQKMMGFNENMLFEEETENVLLSEVNQIIGNNIPILELFPGNGQFTSKLVPGEPLYIADYFQENLDKVGSRFNDFYNSKRLIKLKIDDFKLQLPNDQIGLAVSFKFFFVKDLEFIVNWASEIFRILKPSGSFIFNFIPDNTLQGIRMVERNKLSLVNCQHLKKELEHIGFDVFKISINDNFGTHIIARKPGNLKNIKMSSSIAKIIDKSEPLV